MRNYIPPSFLKPLAETAILRPFWLQNGCCQSPRVVIGRAPEPSAAISQAWNAPVPRSAARESVAPSGDHQGWRLSPGWLVIWRGCEPSGLNDQTSV